MTPTARLASCAEQRTVDACSRSRSAALVTLPMARAPVGCRNDDGAAVVSKRRDVTNGELRRKAGAGGGQTTSASPTPRRRCAGRARHAEQVRKSVDSAVR